MARPHYFYNVLRKTIVQFCDVFNDIVIARYDANGEVTKYVKVPIKFAPKTKQWYWEEMEHVEPVFPTMAIELEDVQYQPMRQVDRNWKVTAANGGGGVKQYYNPAPYDLTFKVMIAAKYFVDITQIVEQIMPFFTPEIYIRVTIPELDIEVNGDTDPLELKVIYQGAAKDIPIQLDEADYRVIEWELTFLVQGYLFTPAATNKPVHSIITNYYLSEDAYEKSGDDVDLPVGELGNQTVQGNLYATYIPKKNRILTVELVDGGTTYDTGTYPLTGGTGSDATIDVTASSGPVTVITINNVGEEYTVDDVLTIDGGTGDATVKVLTVDNEPVDDSIREMFKYEHYESV